MAETRKNTIGAGSVNAMETAPRHSGFTVAEKIRSTISSVVSRLRSVPDGQARLHSLSLSFRSRASSALRNAAYASALAASAALAVSSCGGDPNNPDGLPSDAGDTPSSDAEPSADTLNSPDGALPFSCTTENGLFFAAEQIRPSDPDRTIHITNDPDFPDSYDVTIPSGSFANDGDVCFQAASSDVKGTPPKGSRWVQTTGPYFRAVPMSSPFLQKSPADPVATEDQPYGQQLNAVDPDQEKPVVLTANAHRATVWRITPGKDGLEEIPDRVFDAVRNAAGQTIVRTRVFLARLGAFPFSSSPPVIPSSAGITVSADGTRAVVRSVDEDDPTNSGLVTELLIPGSPPIQCTPATTTESVCDISSLEPGANFTVSSTDPYGETGTRDASKPPLDLPPGPALLVPSGTILLSLDDEETPFPVSITLPADSDYSHAYLRLTGTAEPITTFSNPAGSTFTINLTPGFSYEAVTVDRTGHETVSSAVTLEIDRILPSAPVLAEGQTHMDLPVSAASAEFGLTLSPDTTRIIVTHNGILADVIDIPAGTTTYHYIFTPEDGESLAGYYQFSSLRPSGNQSPGSADSEIQLWNPPELSGLEVDCSSTEFCSAGVYEYPFYFNATNAETFEITVERLSGTGRAGTIEPATGSIADFCDTEGRCSLHFRTNNTGTDRIQTTIRGQGGATNQYTDVVIE